MQMMSSFLKRSLSSSTFSTFNYI